MIEILDLYCGGGGSAYGYWLACQNLGLEVKIVGVDNRPQPHYPFHFVQRDALEFVAQHGNGFAMIHASPECQGYTRGRHIHGIQHPRYISEVRVALQATGRPYVIENVEDAARDMQAPIMLCGVSFDLRVFLHRMFESNFLLLSPPHIPHGDRRIGKDGFCCVAGHGDASPFSRNPLLDKSVLRVSRWKAAMGIDWMTRDELSQAVPPMYTRCVGLQIIPVALNYSL